MPYTAPHAVRRVTFVMKGAVNSAHCESHIWRTNAKGQDTVYRTHLPKRHPSSTSMNRLLGLSLSVHLCIIRTSSPWAPVTARHLRATVHQIITASHDRRTNESSDLGKRNTDANTADLEQTALRGSHNISGKSQRVAVKHVTGTVGSAYHPAATSGALRSRRMRSHNTRNLANTPTTHVTRLTTSVQVKQVLQQLLRLV